MPDDNQKTIVWGAKVSAEFKAAVIAMADRLGTKADYLMAIMAFETGRSFDSAQKNRANKTSGPVGLIQFTNIGAKSVGTTRDALLKMTPVEQLVYVEKFLEKNKHKGLSKLEDLYAAVHFPAAVGRSVDHVLYSTEKNPTYYRLNKGLDTTGPDGKPDGKVTLKEAAAKVWELLAEGESFRG